MPLNRRFPFYAESLIAAVALSLSVVVSGCKEDPTTWSDQKTSPDQVWTASARTIRHGGWGTDGVETLVELKKPTYFSRPVRVLAFANDGPSMKLTMIWTDSKHLRVQFNDDPDMLYFTKSDFYDVIVTVEDLSRNNAAFSTARP